MHEGETAPCPLEPSACEFATALSRWLIEGDFATLISHIRSVDVERTGDERDAELDAVCADAAPGEHRAGYMISGGDTSLGIRLVGGMHTAEQYSALMRAQLDSAEPGLSDAYSSCELKLIGFWRPMGEAANESEFNSDSSFAVVFQYITARPNFDLTPSQPTRVLLFFMVEQPDGEAPYIPADGTGFVKLIPGSRYVDGPDGVLGDTFLPWTPPTGSQPA